MGKAPICAKRVGTNKGDDVDPTPAQLSAYITRLVAYEDSNDFGPWRQRVALTAGVGGFGCEDRKKQCGDHHWADPLALMR